ncbi:MAG TPA: DUF3570 domain-containing protein [Kofleriaceae bacterium]|nr:DUF3570 domain-containing protein [Kofleriaceae bacterium]
MRLQLIALAAALLPAGTARAQPEVHAAADTQVYADDDHVFVITPQAAASATLDDDGSEVHARAVVDVVSAASVDVISNATARFTEVREEGSAGGARRFGEWLGGVDYRYSHEPDYVSNGGTLSVERRLGGADTVGRASYGLIHDRVGRSGTPMDVWSERLISQSADLALTQNLGQRTVARVGYSLVRQDGTMEKPYRYVPLFDQAGLDAADADGATLGLDTFDRYRLPERPPEEVPDARTRHALSMMLLRYIAAWDGSLRGDLRLYTDSWGMYAVTLESGAVVPFGGRWTLELLGRLHQQSSVDFWRRVYVVDDAGELPRWRSMDRELGGQLGAVLGTTVAVTLGRWVLYGELQAIHRRYPDFLLLDARSAAVGMLGARWNP